MAIKYPNMLGVAVGIVAAIILTQITTFVAFLHRLGEFGYLGAFLAGILFSSTFTTAIATIIFFYLGETANPILAALLGGCGAMVSDMLLFRFFRDRLFSEFQLFFVEHHISHLHPSKILRSRVSAWLGPVIASFIILSPLPDEFGVALFSYYKYDVKKLLPLSLALNTLGIYLIMSLGAIFGT